MKRRTPAIDLPFTLDLHAMLKRAPEEPPAAEPGPDLTALVRELGKHLSARRPSTSRATVPSSTTRPAPIAATLRRYEHLETPVETLERMAAAGDKAAQVELDRNREARQRQQAAERLMAELARPEGES
jgi:hypothetical protein